MTPVRVWRDGELLRPGQLDIWPYCTARIGPRDPLWRCVVYGRARRVAPLSRWAAHEPTWRGRHGYAVAQQVLRFMRRFGVDRRLPVLPSELAIRVLRQHLPPGRHLVHLPWEAFKLGVWHEDVYCIIPPCAPGRRREEPEVYVYDLRRAYGWAWRQIPDITRGRWRSTTTWRGRWGVYRLWGRPDSYWSGTLLVDRPELHSRVLRGWYWDGPEDTQLCPGFVERCDAPGLAHRLPALAAGKMIQHETDDRGRWVPRGYNYPPLWAWITGLVASKMWRTIAMYGADVVQAYIDALHLRRPLPPEEVGDGIGQWRLLAHGEGRYLGLNVFVVGDMFRHQGLPGAQAREWFEATWKEEHR